MNRLKRSRTNPLLALQFEFVKQLSDSSNNTLFAIVRNKANATKLEELGRSNIHILEADVTDYKALKVSNHVSLCGSLKCR